MNNKIIINAFPRSGSAWLQFLIHSHKIDTFKSAQWSGNIKTDSFVIRMHSPVTLLGQFDGISQVCVLRDPVDAIASSVTKTLCGFSTRVVGGLPVPTDDQTLNPTQLILGSFDVYENYIYGMENNIKNLKLFTFEQITQDIEFTIKEIVNEKADNKQISSLMKSAEGMIKTFTTESGSSNALPVKQKPESYYSIRDKITSNVRFRSINKMYLDCKNMILESQGRY